MGHRQFTREFNIEAARLLQDRGVNVAQASRALDLQEHILQPWVRELSGDPAQAFSRAWANKAQHIKTEKLRRQGK
jgi:transposase-like protein